MLSTSQVSVNLEHINTDIWDGAWYSLVIFTNISKKSAVIFPASVTSRVQSINSEGARMENKVHKIEETVM